MKVLLLSIGLIVLTLSPAIATTWLVLPDGSGDFPTILNAVAGSAAGDVIELGIEGLGQQKQSVRADK